MKRKQESSRPTSPIEPDNLDIQPDTQTQTPNMPRSRRDVDDDDEVSHHRNYYWSLWDIPKFEGKGEQPFSHLMEFEDYLLASCVRVEPEVGGNTVQPDYKYIINKFKASLKNHARVCFSMYIEKRVPSLHSADGWKAVKSRFLTYFNPIGSTKEQQIKP